MKLGMMNKHYGLYKLFAALILELKNVFVLQAENSNFLEKACYEQKQSSEAY